MASQAAAFYRQRADAGDVQALVELGDLLYRDEPAAARAAYQEAIDAGDQHALLRLAALLLHVLGDEETALKLYQQAAAEPDADLRAEAMYEIAYVQMGRRDAAAARVTFEWVIASGHPVWAAAAMMGLAWILKLQDDPDGAETLYRAAVEAGDAERSAQASSHLGELLERKGDVAGAKAALLRAMNWRPTSWDAGTVFIGLVNLLEQQGDADGLRAAYLDAAELGNPDATYALLRLGELLEAQGDVDGAHAAWQQAIVAGCENPDDWRERMSPSPEPEPEPEPEQEPEQEARAYPPGLPPEFDPANMVRTGIEVLERGLPPLPDVLTYEMALPVAYWIAGQCAVVLVLGFSRQGHEKPVPMAMKISYSRRADGSWEPPTHFSGGSFFHDPVGSPGSLGGLEDSPMVFGGSSQASQAGPGRPASIATGRAVPEVKYLAVIKDGHEDRRPLESHFGAWVVCTEQPGPFEVVGRDARGTVLAVLPYPLHRPSWQP